MTNYFMDGPDENERLERKTDVGLLARQIGRLGSLGQARFLDVGTGTGVVAREAAVRGAICTGVDMDGERLRHAEALDRVRSIQWLQAAATSIPVPDACFDISFSRFLYEYLSDIKAALAEMKRVTVPGGKVCVVDLDGQIESLWPMDSSTGRRLQTALSILSETGFDVRVGRKLYGAFVDLGFEDIEVWVEPYQVFAGGVPAEQVDNWRTKVETVSRWLGARTGDLDAWLEFGDLFEAALKDPRMFYAVNVIQVVGRVAGS